jgi:pSer/pThr/pTyr-binding forkhead associated (FHA) protein
MEVLLSYQSSEGLQEILLNDGSLSFGRGDDVDIRLDDNGLSRLNSTIYREQERIWILDENSTNGTFVNGSKVLPNGTILKAGDVIKIGNSTEIRLKVASKKEPEKPVVAKAKAAASSSNSNNHMVLPILAVMIAVFVISVSALVIGAKYIGSTPTEIVKIDDNNDEFYEPTPKPTREEEVANKNTSTKSNTKPSANQQTNESNIALTNSPTSNDNSSQPAIPSGKKYLEMSDSEKRIFIESRAGKVARMIGNRDAGKIPTLAIDRIKGFLDAYAKRVNVGKLGGCRFGDNLAVTLERASKNAPFIVHAFNSEGIDPQIGLYLAMIESEHCVCLQSPTGPLGMFQFTKSTGEAYGLQVFRGASPTNPDERCKPEPAARAAAKYMKFLQGRYGTDPSSVPLAIGSYNSGEGGLSTNLKTALDSNQGLPRDFWSLIENGEKLSKQFQSENFKYVPKFFAAAIIGENPPDFGVNLQPLSTYTK